MQSMEQPWRSRAERILAVIDHTNVDFVARIRTLMLGTSLLPGQASCGGAISLGGAMSHRRCARELGGCESAAKPVVIPSVRSMNIPWAGGLILNNRATKGARITPVSQAGSR